MGTVPNSSWLFPTAMPASELGTVPRIRVSARARRLSIRVYPDARVECVVPPRARPREIEAFIAAHREWIDSRRAIALRNRPEPQPFPPASDRTADVRRSSGGCTWRATPGACAGARGRSGNPARDGWRFHADRLRAGLRTWLLRAARTRLRTARGGDRAGHGRELFAGFHPPPAFSLGKLFGARYHQPQLLPAVPAPGSGGLPHRARAHACEAHEPLGAFLAGSGTSLPRLARARSRARAGLAPRAFAGSFPNEIEPWPTTRSISRTKACTGTWALPSPMANTCSSTSCSTRRSPTPSSRTRCCSSSSTRCRSCGCGCSCTSSITCSSACVATTSIRRSRCWRASRGCRKSCSARGACCRR